MSQHDMDVANQAGAAFRADMNDALQALASNSSGSSAPTTTYAYQFWADTNAGLLRMRNAANNAWVTIGLLGVPNFGHTLPGTVVFHSKNAAPAGYLKCNGGAVSRTVYADLWNEIGSTFGSGDGSTTFNLPDIRGEFPRGWDDSRGVDAGRAFGSAQSQSFQSHIHTLDTRIMIGQIASSGLGAGIAAGAAYNAVGMLFESGVSGTGSANGGVNETRPRNVALLACIKY